MNVKQTIEKYLKERSIKANRFYGRCFINEKGNLLIGDILSKEEGNLLLRDNGDRLQINISKENTYFKDGKFYEFSIYIPASQKKEELVIVADTQINPPIELTENPYKEIVRLRYERLDNPEANRMIAHLMREIGKGLYSSKQRMIFELLQNADDTPAGDEVSFHIDAHNDYFLVMHNGLPFNKDDVEAITSAAESTKKHDKKKTGYKGIGFKSVFTDSEEVIVKSGSFLFAFKRNHPTYKEFDKFYFNKERYKKYPDLLEEDIRKYERQRKTFNGNNDIPWQLIPLWLTELPQGLDASRLAKFNNNVGFALKFGREKNEEYLNAVSLFAFQPQFMLFLRHINLFKSFKNAITVKKTGENPVKIERIASDGNNISLLYFKKTIDDILVNDDALENEGIKIYKKEKTNDYGETSHYFSYDIEGERPVESIPPKLAAFDTTSITFAAPVINGKVQAEPDYLNGKLASSFFTYLPMKETRIRLPFLINADFVPSSNREELQGDNQWNEYIISKIASSHVQWLRELALESLNSNNLQSEYLSLLLKDVLAKDDTVQLLIDRYNRIYLETLNDLEFIQSDKGHLCKKSAIIIDETGLSKILNDKVIYEISATEKCLPHPLVNSSYLKYDYLNIERYKTSQIIEDLKTIENKNILATEIKELEKSKYEAFLNWLDILSFTNDVTIDWLFSLPIIRFNQDVLSLQDAIQNLNLHIKTTKSNKIESILKKIGYTLSEFHIDDYSHIFSKVFQIESYLNKDLKLYERISNNPNLCLLNSKEKCSLIIFMESLEGVGEVRYAESLKLFKPKNEKGTLRPLNKLISNSCINLPEWLIDFVIEEEEEKELPESFRKYLIMHDDLLEKIFCNPSVFEELKVNISIEKIDSFYSYIVELYKTLPSDANLTFTKTPWLYVSKTNSFQMPAQVYCPDIVLSLTLDIYNHINYFFESVSDVLMPHFASLKIVTLLSLGCQKSATISKSASFDSLTSIDLLNTMVDKNFLIKFNFTKNENEFVFRISNGNKHQYFTKDLDLIQLINDNPISEKLVLLPEELYTNTRKNIGLLDENDLIKYLIDNGLASIQLAKFIYKLKDEELKKLFITKITSIELTSEKIYDKETVEHKFFEMVISVCKEDELVLAGLKTKIKIDDKPLHEKNISDNVFFKIPAKDALPDRTYTIRLSFILPNYKDETAALTNVIENFVDLESRSALRKNIFGVVGKDWNDIYKEILSSKPSFLTPYQVFFMLLLKEISPKLDYKPHTCDFDSYWFEKDKEVLKKLELEMLNIFYEANYYSFAFGHKYYFYLRELVLEYLIYDVNYALNSEMIPDWVINWINESETEKKLAFLKSALLNFEESPVVQLREGIINNKIEQFEKGLVNVEFAINVTKTLEWLKKISEEQNFVLKSEYLRPIYSKLSSLKVKIEDILIPVLNDVQKNSYQLIKYSNENEYHLISSDWGKYTEEVYEAIVNLGKYVIDELMPQNYVSLLKPIKANVISNADIIDLEQNSFEYDEPYYLDWKLKTENPIFIYKKKQLPYKITYYNIFSLDLQKGIVDKVGKRLYVVNDEINNLPYVIRTPLTEPVFRDLLVAKSDFEERQKREQYEAGYSDDEFASLKKLFGNSIPKEYHKDLNLAAVIKAMMYLQSQGYDISEAEENLKGSHKYAQLEPVYLPGKEKNKANAIKVKCRSAKSGLLYLRASSWLELEDESTYLYILKGRNFSDCKFCTSREEVINDTQADFQVMRIESGNNVQSIDSILIGDFNPKDLWLIIRVIDKLEFKSIFENIKKTKSRSSFRNVNFGDESID